MSAAGSPGARRFTALVLAGSRGRADPVARARGVAHKALVPVAGVPMLHRVVGALRATSAVGRVVVSAEDRSLLDGLPEPGGLGFAASGASPSDSVRRAVAGLDDPFPVLVATADHPLLTAAMVDHFCREAGAGAADVAAALAPASVVLGAYPGSRRTFLKFRDGRYSGCNLFALMTPAALRAVAFWERVEPHRKRPWRLFRAIGPVSLVLMLCGALTLDRAVARLSARVGVRMAAIPMPFAEAAIDVDHPADLDLVEEILGRRSVAKAP